jgi:hypothetical protein
MTLRREMLVPVTASSAAHPAEAVHHDPAWLVRCAWSEFRLPRLQELIRLTISGLQTLPPPNLIRGDSVCAPACDPVAEALRACCEELRDASGMPGAETDRAQHCRTVRDYMAQQPTVWGETFMQALEEYRKAATKALEVTLGRGVRS